MSRDIIMGRKILDVGDYAAIRTEVAEYVQHKGYEVEEAADGVEALEKFEAAPADLVITDIRMPRIDGYEVIRRIREINPRVPIIATTGHYSPADLKKAKEAGATLTMKKPIRLRKLGQKLKSLLEADEE